MLKLFKNFTLIVIYLICLMMVSDTLADCHNNLDTKNSLTVSYLRLFHNEFMHSNVQISKRDLLKHYFHQYNNDDSVSLLSDYFIIV